MRFVLWTMLDLLIEACFLMNCLLFFFSSNNIQSWDFFHVVCFNIMIRIYGIPLLSISIETSDLLQKLSLDSQTKTLEMSEPTSKVICTL